MAPCKVLRGNVTDFPGTKVDLKEKKKLLQDSTSKSGNKRKRAFESDQKLKNSKDAVPMECFLEHFQNAIFARDGFVIPQVCTDAVGIYQSGVSVRIPPLNLSVSREGGKIPEETSNDFLLKGLSAGVEEDIAEEILQLWISRSGQSPTS